ncbi:hypothetical protein AAC387_Pa01g0050 [Persea americana]|eukprot:TRINITY_DN1760_c1_g1_i1.p1 TRINITY_DN1760_c1_g1~~TRINITY_DN1760_c1_g1_i1.p1  ORF type:complete len:255 (+),score=62.18 TRINITY_DN1760_c1_g1_i1:298-1062(+)
MVSDLSLPMAAESNMENENSVSRSLPNKKKPGKVPKKIHKAEREKLKRDHLNELFLELGHVLEPARQNNGKASILGDATRILRDLFAQVECLRKENVALVTESHYVTVEKNELKEETVVLGGEVEKLHNELQQRMRSEAGWCNGLGPVQPQHANLGSSFPEDGLSDDNVVQPPPVVGPVFVLPFRPEVQAYQEPDTVQALPSKPTSHVRRPQPRYPTPSDTWPSQLLAASGDTQEAQIISSTSTSNGESGSSSE